MTACTKKTKPANKKPIPEARITISKNPVASYLIPMGNPKLDRKFGVEIYETPYTFKYLLVMQYDGMIQTDALKIPNFGISPVVKIKPGAEKLSCIIGFLDERNNFREYKMLSAKNDDLKLTVLKSYVVSGN
jgi:hypothetical protein